MQPIMRVIISLPPILLSIPLCAVRAGAIIELGAAAGLPVPPRPLPTSINMHSASDKTNIEFSPPLSLPSHRSPQEG